MVFGIVEVLLSSGITLGWTNIVVVFRLKHFYLKMCKQYYVRNNMTEFDIVNTIDDKLLGCPNQEARLNLIFTVATFTLCGSVLVGGIFSDKCGQKTVRAVGG